MPFDPLWQLLNYPVSNFDFSSGKTPTAKPTKYFDYNDSIAIYLKQSGTEKLVSSIRRIENNGVTNNLVAKKLSLMREDLRIQKENELIAQYNVAVEYYNAAVKNFDRYIAYRNRKFNTAKGVSEIQGLLSDSETFAESAHGILHRIAESPSETRSNALSLLACVNKLKGRIAKHKQ